MSLKLTEARGFSEGFWVKRFAFLLLLSFKSQSFGAFHKKFSLFLVLRYFVRLPFRRSGSLGLGVSIFLRFTFFMKITSS
nr:hypothetical protein CFP56_66188 [Quercus suber]